MGGGSAHGAVAVGQVFGGFVQAEVPIGVGVPQKEIYELLVPSGLAPVTALQRDEHPQEITG